MDFSLFNDKGGALLLEPVLPHRWKNFMLPGSQPLSASGDFGSILIQQYQAENFSIRYFVLDLVQKVALQWKEEEKLIIQAALSQGYHYERGQAHIALKPSQYNLVWAPGTVTNAHFSKGNLYRLFHTLCAPPLVQKLVPSFFDLQQQHIEKQAFYMEREVSDAINKIVAAPYEAPALDFFFETRLRDVFFTTLQKGGRKFYKGITQNDLSAIYTADNLILNNLDKHFTIKEIAEKVGLNEFKLKTGFKKITGMALFERLHKARMEKARTLLLQTDMPIKAIYETIGYDHLTSFITSFRKHFGITPGEIRRDPS
jgi:AraC-like DNA-binding protein